MAKRRKTEGASDRITRLVEGYRRRLRRDMLRLADPGDQMDLLAWTAAMANNVAIGCAGDPQIAFDALQKHNEEVLKEALEAEPTLH